MTTWNETLTDAMARDPRPNKTTLYLLNPPQGTRPWEALTVVDGVVTDQVRDEKRGEVRVPATGWIRRREGYLRETETDFEVRFEAGLPVEIRRHRGRRPEVEQTLREALLRIGWSEVRFGEWETVALDDTAPIEVR